MRVITSGLFSLTLFAACWISSPTLADETASSFYRGYYLQQQGDFPGAIEQYKAALAEDGNGELKTKILAQLDSMSQTVVADDLARLAPADTIAYIELSAPGDHLERLAKTMGLVGRQPNGEDRVLLPLEDGLVLPSDFQLSPALMESLKQVKGVAFAVTGVDAEEEEPEGVIIIHAGESNLLRGLVDTGVQVIPREESIGGCETFCIEDEMWFVKKGPLLIASDSPDQIRRSLAQLDGTGSSLAQDEQFIQQRSARDDSMFFAYVGGARLMKEIGPHLDEEAAVARVVFGLDRLQHLTATMGATDSGAAAQLKLKFDEGYQGLAYGLLKTEPLSDELLDRIPSGSAVVAALGVNPQLVTVAQAKSSEHFSALDIGRELFANIQNVGVFLLPSVASHGDEVPDFGLVVLANNAERSEHIWNQLLSLPSQLGVEDGIRMEKVKLAGRSARRYSFPDEDAPQLMVARLDDKSLLLGTESAVKVACQTADNEHPSASADNDLKTLLSNRPEHTAKAVFAHIGRTLQLAGQLEGANGSDIDEIRAASQALGQTRVAITSDEAPSELTIRVEADGLPLFEQIIKTIAKASQRADDSHVAYDE